MVEPSHKHLRQAENLRREGKFQEALEVIHNIEKKGPLTPRDQLSLLISKGKILTVLQRHIETIRVGDLAYRLSQTLDSTTDIIWSLIFKGSSLWLGQYDKALKNLFKAEKLLNTLTDVSPSYISRQRKNILSRRSWAYYYKGEINEALKDALECLELLEKFKNQSDTAYIFLVLANVYRDKGEIDLSLDYASRSLKLFKEIGDEVGSATSLSMLGANSLFKGEFDQAIKFCKQSLSYKMIGNRNKADTLNILGQVYVARSETDKALKYFKQGITIAEKENIYDSFVRLQTVIGNIYYTKGEYDLAIEYLKPSLSLAEKMGDSWGIALSYYYLGLVLIEKGAFEEFQNYLEQMKRYEAQWESALWTSTYQLLRAVYLKAKGGTRNRAEAEQLLKQNITSESTTPFILRYSLFALCEFYIEELTLFEDMDLLNELNPIMEQIFKITEEQRMYGLLAEVKLLQAKVALIQLDFEEAKRLLTQAQRVAEMYGLNLLAGKISNEHDLYLDKLKEWKALKERDVPVSERLKLASVDDVLERLQGKRTIEPIELIEEEPIVLLIMDKNGISYFNYPFIENWDFEWLFSSFMSAFDTFSSEVFSESIDRIKIGENLILINPIESFLVCYVIKGQSYPGLQKLNRFSKAIKSNTEIWECLNRAVKSGEVLELDKPQSLRNIVNEIFS